MTDKPRVVMLTPDEVVDRRILQQRDSLRAAGFDVRLITAGAAHDPAAGQTARSGRIRRAMVSAFDMMHRLHPATATRINLLAKRRMVRPFFRVHAMFDAALRDIHADIVVAHDLPVLGVARDAAARIGARLVYDSHELFAEQDVPRDVRDQWRRAEASLIGDCDLVMTVNRSIADELERRYGIAGVEVILNAAPFQAAVAPSGRLQAALGLDARTRIALFQGHLLPFRNLETLARAGGGLPAGTALVLIGDGPEDDRLQALVRSAGLGDRVFFHPHVTQEVLAALTADAALGIIPYRATSRNTELCTPNKLFEYIAAQVPVLADDLPELRRFVVGYGIGEVGKMDDPAVLGHRIAAALRDDARLAAWRAALVPAAAALCWEVEGEKLVGLYRRLLAG